MDGSENLQETIVVTFNLLVQYTGVPDLMEWNGMEWAILGNLMKEKLNSKTTTLMVKILLMVLAC